MDKIRVSVLGELSSVICCGDRCAYERILVFVLTAFTSLFLAFESTAQTFDLSVVVGNKLVDVDELDEDAGSTTVTVTALESNGNAVLTEHTINVVVGAATDSAVEGTDYATVNNFDIIIAANNRSNTGTFDLNPTRDDSIEGDEILTVSGSVTQGTGTVNSTTVTITDPDAASVTLSLNPDRVNEGAGMTTITVTATVDGGNTFDEEQTINVVVGAAADSATEGTDYATVAGFDITIDANDPRNAGTFSLDLTGDAFDEGDETVSVKGTFGNPLVDAVAAQLTIVDDIRKAAVARQNRVNEELVPRISQVSTESVLSAITNRIDSVLAGSAPADLNMSTGGLFLHQLLSSTSKSLSDDTLSSAEVLGNSSFALPLNASSDNGTDGVGIFAVWGSGDYSKLSSADGDLLDWDGSVVSFHVGGDMRIRHDLLAGLSISRSLGSFDFTDRTDPNQVSGTYESRMTSVHPYMNWSLSEVFDVWATVGYGKGKIEIEDKGGTRSNSTKMTTAALGASAELYSDEDFLPGGTTTLRLKIDGLVARVEVAGNGDTKPLSSDHQRVRLSIEGSHERQLDSGSLLTPSLEVSLRHDSGDAANGTGVELGGSLRYVDAATGLTLEARGRALVDGKHGREDWGVGGLIRLDPGNDRRGLSLSVSPTRGNLNSGAQQLWDTGMTEVAVGGDTQGGRVDAEIGYGIAVSGRDVITPFGGLSMEEGDSRSYRMGARLDMGSFLNLNIEGKRREMPATTPIHDIRVQGELRW
ncbi:MAG: hypothetical protein J4F49_11390 [Rhodobacteraceae bacterium]|nr:hypothetical protein [Paracoccaceae bacterium]